MTTRTVRNWAGNVRFAPRRIARPTTPEEVRDLVREARREGFKVRAVGAGHSFSRLIETEDVLVDLSALSGILAVDKKQGIATLAAGTTIRDAGPLLAKHGLALPNQGDIDRQTLAGALSTGTHGTGLEFASLAGFATAMTLIDGRGERVHVRAADDQDFFDGHRVGLGALGLITEVTLALRPSYVLRDERHRVGIEECLDGLDDAVRRNRHFEFFWFPYSDQVQIKRCNEVERAAPRNPLARLLADDVLERVLYGAVCEVGAALPSASAPLSRLCGRLMPDSNFADASYRVFPSSRHVRFNEMEYAVPLAKGRACFEELRAFIERERIRVFFPIEFRVAGPDAAWTSPMYGRESAILSLHVFRGVDQQRYFAGAEAIFRRFAGRPHWGKVHHTTRPELERLYPRWRDFCTLRRERDPDGVFLNGMLAPYFAVTASSAFPR